MPIFTVIAIGVNATMETIYLINNYLNDLNKLSCLDVRKANGARYSDGLLGTGWLNRKQNGIASRSPM